MDSKEKSGLAAVVAATDAVAKSEHEAALVMAKADAKAEGEKAGTAAAQARIKAILTAKEAKGRDDLAEHLAFNTAMSAEDAVATLAAAPKAEAVKPGSRLDALMEDQKPKVDTAASTEATPAAELAANMTAQIARLTGKAA